MRSTYSAQSGSMRLQLQTFDGSIRVPMLALLLYIGLTVFLGIVFKVWKGYGIHVLPGILHNYVACMVMSILFQGGLTFSIEDVLTAAWFPVAVPLSILFISGFYVFAVALHLSGVGSTTAIQKMSLLINVVFASFYFGVTPGAPEFAGILLGSIALPLLVIPATDKGLKEFSATRNSTRVWPWLLITFLISGAVEIGLTLVEIRYSESSADPLFIGTIFSMAFLIGSIILIFKPIQRIHFFSIRHWIAGWCLGIPNYLSIHFLMKALGSEIPTYLIMPMANVGTILVAVLVGWRFFSEKLDLRKILGILMAIASLLLMTLPKLP